MTKPTCRTCPYWQKNRNPTYSYDANKGECRIGRPDAAKNWPVTEHDDFCGEHPQFYAFMVDPQMSKRILRITDALLLDIFQEGHDLHCRIKSGLPPDVKIVDFKMEGSWKEGSGVACLLLESEAWEAIPQGQEYPDVEVRLEALYPRATQFLTFDESLGYPVFNSDESASPP